MRTRQRKLGSTTTDTGTPFPDTEAARSRRVFTAPAQQEAEPTEEMRALARAAYIANTTKNKAAGEEEAARKSLLTQMSAAGITGFSFQTRVTGAKGEAKVVGIDVVREAKQTLVVDCAALRQLVGDDLFMQIVSATKTSIEKHVGAVIATQVTSYVPSAEETVKVKPAK